MEKWDIMHDFLENGSYPEDYNKSQKQNLRRYASKFQIKDGDLFFEGRRKAVKTMEEARILFQEFHSSPIGGHSGIMKTRAAICARFYWPGMTVDVENWVLECDKCQKTGKPFTVAQPLRCIKVSAVWELIGIDLTGPLPKSADGFQYILTLTDYFSKWVEAFPLKSKTASEVAKHLCATIYRHGCPKRILSDQGREFVNELNQRLCDMLHIERSVTAAYHPQTNGLDEKTNDNIKRALKKLVNDKQNDWDVYLDATLFSLRSKVHTTTKHTPFLLMYGREAVFPSELPVDLPLSTVILPEGGYGEFLQSKKINMEAVKKTAEENTKKSQDKQKEAYAKRVQKKYKHIVYNVGDEVLLLNMRKRGRKGGRMEPDFSGPYTITSLCGKLVKLRNNEGATLKTKYNLSHLKPYRRSQNDLGRSVPVSQPADNSLSPVSQLADNSRPLVSQPASSKCSDLVLKRPPVILFAPKTTTEQVNSTTVAEKPTMEDTSTPRSTQEAVLRLWSLKDTGAVEAVVGLYKLYDSSFRTLQGHEWLADEVIDAYLHHLIEEHKMPVYYLSAVLGGSLFAGQFRCFSKMKFPVQDTWLCPVNTGAHWTIVIVSMSKRALTIIDPIGQESFLERKIPRNWRNFLKTRNHKDHRAEWHMLSVQHNLQQDSSSCGVLVLKFTEDFFLTGDNSKLQTTEAAMSSARMEIACSLLEYRGNADDYCIICSMLEGDADKSITEMVQCELCSRWAHFECAQYDKDKETSYYCKKCLLNK